jgi:hypothetical protein
MYLTMQIVPLAALRTILSNNLYHSPITQSVSVTAVDAALTAALDYRKPGSTRFCSQR